MDYCLTKMIEDLPKELSQLIANYDFQPIILGKSGTKVYRLTQNGVASLYLKISSETLTRSLFAEKERITWLQDKLPVPQIYYYGQNQHYTFLLLSEIPGINASDKIYESDRHLLVKLLAEGLKLIHTIPIVECPFDCTLDREIALAEYNTKHQLIDELDFDQTRKGRTAKDLLTELIANRPISEDLVFTHGDYCLPNIIFHNETISGFIDLGAAGIGDRYRDLALASRSLAANFGRNLVPLLFQAYGLQKINREKLAYYNLLDEFF
jgi:aminoglycoside phosphotransferase